LRDGSRLVFHTIKTSDDIGIWRKSSAAEEMLLATARSLMQLNVVDWYEELKRMAPPK
jgi:hypothetical protein